MHLKYLTALMITVLLLPASGRPQNYDVSGYLKYMFSSTRYPGISDRLNDHLLHTRLNTRWYPSKSIRGAMEIRFRGWAGDSPEHIPDYKDIVQSNYEFTDLDLFLWEKDATLGYGEIDRLYFDFTHKALQLTAGRQRIAWGTTHVWNLTDLFNPMSILNFDYEEKPGADALRFQYFTGPVSRMELVYKPGKDKYGTTVAALWTTNTLQYDLYLLGGLQNNRWVIGSAWDGYIRGGGFRGELKLSEQASEGPPLNDPYLRRQGTPYRDDENPVFSAALSGDYTFPNSFYIHTEALFNSNGVSRDAGLYQSQAMKAGLLSPARWSLFQEFAYNVTPLTRATIFTLWNPDDGSTITVPMIDWSVFTNWDLTLVGFLASGGNQTEFGAYGKAAFIRLKFSF